jgi:hypothetical protein
VRDVLDLDALERLSQLISNRLAEEERRRRNREAMKGLFGQISSFSAGSVSIMVSAEAQMRKSVLAMEESLRTFPERQRVAEEKAAAQLATAKSRTAVLRAWLEALG